MKKLVTLAVAATLLLGACGGGSSNGGSSDGGSSSADATKVAESIKTSVESVGKVVTVTEDNDPNNKIGRPNGYVSAAVIYDEALDCGEDLGVDCGATVEVWSSADAAKERSEYIQGLQESSPMLGSEYNYLDGATLLRVSGDVKPSVAKEYEAAFANG